MNKSIENGIKSDSNFPYMVESERKSEVKNQRISTLENEKN